MAAAHPTKRGDLRRVRQHRWSKEEPVCLDCGVRLDHDLFLGILPACPGPFFELRVRGKHEARYPEV